MPQPASVHLLFQKLLQILPEVALFSFQTTLYQVQDERNEVRTLDGNRRKKTGRFTRKKYLVARAQCLFQNNISNMCYNTCSTYFNRFELEIRNSFKKPHSRTYRDRDNM